jgi:hypothetical protein
MKIDFDVVKFAQFASNLYIRDVKMKFRNFEISEIWLLEM